MKDELQISILILYGIGLGSAFLFTYGLIP